MELTDTSALVGSKSQLQISTRRSRVWSLVIQSVTRGSKSWFFNCRLPLAWHSCMRSACDQSTLPIDVQVFHCKARDPHVDAWRVGCHLSCPPRHSTEVPNHTVYERRVRYTLLLQLSFFWGKEETLG
ncbi:uncharacterized protein TNCV_3577001 [Trichonephila clavipes]|uniref:Uncharacterized protein n=1 Tax=Trichonephila clavipes TaxID=2585209 RepID=A0A8X6RD40_TRICX|nr:uncharacterized protein TNCV_3577001 [Trichonephila clavipes]